MELQEVESLSYNRSGLLSRYKDASMDNLVDQTADKLKLFLKDMLEMDLEEIAELDPNALLWGARRIGKTWCLHIFANHLVEKFGNDLVYYTTSYDIIQYHREDIMTPDSRNPIKMRSHLARVRFLFIDDFGHEYKKSTSDFAEKAMERFLRFRFNENKPTFIAMDFNPRKELKTRYSKSLADLLLNEYDEYDIETGENISALLKNKKFDEWAEKHGKS